MGARIGSVIMTECDLRSFGTQNTLKKRQDENFPKFPLFAIDDILLWSFIYKPCDVQNFGTQNTLKKRQHEF